MANVRYILLSAIFLAAAAACWIVQHSTDVALRERDDARRKGAETQALIAADNLALSNRLAQLNNADRLTAEECRELSRLRGEIALLRGQIREIDSLRERNSQHLAVLARSGTSDDEQLPRDAAKFAEDYWARDEFAFAGFAEPESALKTTLWIWADADLESLLPHCTPEQRAQLEQVWTQQSETEMAAMRKRMAAMYSLDRGGVRLMGKKLTSPNEALLDLYFEGDSKRRRFSLQKSGEQWVVTGLVAIYN